MSEHEDSGFATEGFKEYPNLYLDAQRLHNVVDWSDEHLVEKIKQYGEFLGDPTILPGHRVQAQRMIDHMGEELCWRDTGTMEVSLKDYDELCEGV